MSFAILLLGFDSGMNHHCGLAFLDDPHTSRRSIGVHWLLLRLSVQNRDRAGEKTSEKRDNESRSK
jgi:hypothetical protein